MSFHNSFIYQINGESVLAETGVVNKTTALDLMKNLSEHEQEELISTLDATKKYK